MPFSTITNILLRLGVSDQQVWVFYMFVHVVGKPDTSSERVTGSFQILSTQMSSVYPPAFLTLQQRWALGQKLNPRRHSEDYLTCAMLNKHFNWGRGNKKR